MLAVVHSRSKKCKQQKIETAPNPPKSLFEGQGSFQANASELIFKPRQIAKPEKNKQRNIKAAVRFFASALI